MDGRSDGLSRDEAHRALVPLMRVDNFTNVRCIALEYLGLALVLGSAGALQSAWAGGKVGWAGYLAAAAPLVVLAAVFQHRLSGLAHEASHGTLFRNRLANELVSDFLLMFPLVALTQKYRAAHLGHHRFVNDPGRDPDLVRLNHPEPHIFPVSKRGFWARYVVRALWPPSILRYLLGRALAANVGEDKRPEVRPVYRTRVARCLRGTYWLSVLAVVNALHAWHVFFVFWVLPLLTVYPFLMQLREIAHHSNAPDNGDLTNSRVFEVNPLLEAAVFPYGQAFHLTHHLFSMVPHYRVAQAHQILLRSREYRESARVCRGYFFRRLGTDGPSVLDVLSEPGRTSIYRGPVVRRAARSRVA